MYDQQAYQFGSQRSCIRELFEYGLQQKRLLGDDRVYDFSLGNPSAVTPRQVTETYLDLLNHQSPLLLHSYTPAAGRLATRIAIVSHLNETYGTSFEPSELFLTCGAAAALTIMIRALSLPPDSTGKPFEVVVLAPYFPEYSCFVESAGGRVRVVQPQLPSFALDLAAIAEAIGKQTQAVIINSPNNPSGIVYSLDQLKQLADLLAEKSRALGRPIYLISDEPYREIVYNGTEVPFLPSLYTNTVICYSYSKIFSLPGERIGYLLIPAQVEDSRELYAACAGSARGQGFVCAPSLAQHVIERCARVKPDLSLYQTNRQILTDSLSRFGYTFAEPKGAFYLFVKSPTGKAKSFSDLARRENVLIVPGDDFGMDDYLRISYCVSQQTIENALPVLARLCN